MPQALRVLGLLGLLFFAANGQQGSRPARGTAWSLFGRDSPLQFFSLLSQLPVKEQRAYLKVTGAALQEQTHSVCNVFGGSDSCQSLPAGSDFALKCPGHDLKVDCAYYSEDLAEVQQDPAEQLRTSLAKLGYSSLESACPACFANQLALWCAQTVPKCGSFAAAVEGSLLPAITTITQAQEAGQPPIEALSAAVPQLLAATDLSMPCSQMCEALVSTCGCKTELKFGPLLDTYLASGAVNVPAGFTAQMFGGLYNRPICSLYGNASAPGFAGHCDPLPQTCTDPTRWCKAQQADSAGSEVQQLMAAQLAFALFGWLDAPAESIFQDAAGAVGSADQKDAKSLEDKYLVAGSSSSRSGSSTWAIVAHTLVAVALVVLLAGAVFLVVRRRRQADRWASSQGYLGMGDEDAAEGAGFLASEAPRS